MLTVARGDTMHGCSLHNIPGQDNTGLIYEIIHSLQITGLFFKLYTIKTIPYRAEWILACDKYKYICGHCNTHMLNVSMLLYQLTKT